MVLSFSDYLSSYGDSSFRIQTKDPLASQGLFNPYENHIKVLRGDSVVWSGVIVNNNHRNHNFIEVNARTNAFLFHKVSVAHNYNSVEGNTTGTLDVRFLNSGTLASNITTIFNEGKNRGDSPISDFTLGTITNPKYPWDSKTEFTFSDVFSDTIQASTMMQTISYLADISNSDWEVTHDKVFSFKPQLGRTRPDIVLSFGRGGNVVDYDSPLDGANMMNDLYVASMDKQQIKYIDKQTEDSSLYPTYKRLWSSMLFNDFLEQKQLEERAKKILDLNKTPDTQISLVLGDKASPIGTYSLGDYVKVIIKDGPIDVNKERRVIGWEVYVNDNGVETSTIHTNTRFDRQDV